MIHVVVLRLPSHVLASYDSRSTPVMIELSDNKLTPAEELELRHAREAVGMGD